MLNFLNNYLYILFIFLLSLVKIDNYNINYSDNKLRLIIPTIQLDENIYDYDSKYNSVDYGLELINNYDIKKQKGSIIIASHSGNSSISYFKNLYKLKIGELVILQSNDEIYYYKINSIYKIKKNGTFKYKDIDSGIYLITCDKKNKKKQLVFQGKLEKIEKNRDFYKKNTIFSIKKKEIRYLSDIYIIVEVF